MMDFALDDTQSALRDLARRVFEENATSDRLKQLEAGGPSVAGFDAELWGSLRRSGLLGVGVEDGGFVEQCIVLVEQGRKVAPVPLWSHMLASTVVAPEPDEILTLAIDDGTRRIAGVPAVELARRIVVAGSDDISVMDAADVEWERQLITNGQCEYVVSVPAKRGEAVAGDASALERKATVAMCALGVGVAERVLEITASYTTERVQFDRPLASFQAVQQRAADAYIDVEAMRLSMWQAAWRIDQRLEADREVAIAKFWTSEGGQRVVSAAQHLHGGMGADVDYPLFRYTLWAKWIELAFGSATPQLARLGAGLAR